MTIVKVVQGSRGDERYVVLGEGGAESKVKKQLVMRKEPGGWKVFSVGGK